MLCQLSYRGLTTTRLRRLAAWSAYVVFRFDLLHCLINGGSYAVSLPTQPSGKRAVPLNRAAAQISTSRNDHSPLSSQRDKYLDGDCRRDLFTEQIGQSTRLSQLQYAASRYLSRQGVADPAELVQLSVP